jgi:hypothetical protein
VFCSLPSRGVRVFTFLSFLPVLSALLSSTEALQAQRGTTSSQGTSKGASGTSAGATSGRSTTPNPAATAKAADTGPIYHPDKISPELEKEFVTKGYKRDPKSGNFLSPKVFGKTLQEDLVPVQIDGKYIKDLKGQPIFLRKSIRDKLLEADAAMFKKKKMHIVPTYGFRSNALQQELFHKLAGHGKVAPAGGSFHETGMALDLSNWHDAQGFMIDAGFVGGCYGIEEDLVHYSINEITKASNLAAFKRCTLREIPEKILKPFKKLFGKDKK